MPDNSEMLDILDGKVPVQTSTPPVEPVNVPAPADTAIPPVQPVASPPVNTPPAQSPSDSTPPNIPPADDKSFDSELLKVSNGAVKSKEDIAALIEKSARFTDLENQLKTYETENNSLKAKVEADPFANDLTKRLNDLYKGGANDNQIQAFLAINKVQSFDSLTPVEAKTLRLQIENGLTPEEAKDYVNDEYKIDAEKFNAEDVNRGTLKLKIEAKNDLDFLKNHKATVSAVPVDNSALQQQELQQRQTEHISKLSPLAANVVANVSFKGLSINGKEGDANVTADFEPSPESLQSLNDSVVAMIKSNWENIPATQEGQKMIQSYAENVLVLQNYKNWIQHAAATRETQVRAEYHNPTPINRGKDNPVKVNTTKEAFEQQLLDSYN